MANTIKSSHYCLIWTFFSTVIVYMLLGFSRITFACFLAGSILSFINFIEDEMKKHYAESGSE
ncbi:hypothetical protein [Robertmurraya mangrovi]|uniref:hypothetical protein n=1 Tax=Robertmurraya mangrovi TaxID=3098077 RepID=UPI002ACBEBEC|nr:hypothetical protein [Bacillus sp. 31A1R]